METIDLKKNGVVELSLDEMKNIEGGSLLAFFVIGLIVGFAIALRQNQ